MATMGLELVAAVLRRSASLGSVGPPTMTHFAPRIPTGQRLPSVSPADRSGRAEQAQREKRQRVGFGDGVELASFDEG